MRYLSDPNPDPEIPNLGILLLPYNVFYWTDAVVSQL